ncbi:MAG: hypothetical protein ABI365_03125 [Lysobacteraceae bacterium]
MLRLSLLIVALMTAASPATASIEQIQPTSDAPSHDVEAAQHEIQSGFQHVQANELADAAKDFDTAIHLPGFAGVSDDLRYQTLLAAGQIANQDKRYDVALDLLKRATASDVADSDAWQNRLLCSLFVAGLYGRLTQHTHDRQALAGYTRAN